MRLAWYKLSFNVLGQALFLSWNTFLLLGSLLCRWGLSFNNTFDFFNQLRRLDRGCHNHCTSFIVISPYAWRDDDSRGHCRLILFLMLICQFFDPVSDFFEPQDVFLILWLEWSFFFVNFIHELGCSFLNRIQHLANSLGFFFSNLSFYTLLF